LIHQVQFHSSKPTIAFLYFFFGSPLARIARRSLGEGGLPPFIYQVHFPSSKPTIAILYLFFGYWFLSFGSPSPASSAEALAKAGSRHLFIKYSFIQ
jgi:hypothetical protein